MASLSLPPSRSGFSQHFDTTVDPSHRLSMPAPQPNPPFVFPARDPEPKSNSEARPALPAFSFNPGSDHSLPTHVPSRHNGHRRRHSEFVGSDLLVTPMDERREEPATPVLPTAPAVPTGPSPGRGPPRRGHAHRRSAAVSGVDLLAIQKAIGSAPPTGDRLDPGHEDISRPLSYSAGSLGRPSPPASPQFAPSSSPVPPVPSVPAIIHIQPPPPPKVHDIQIGRSGPPPSPSPPTPTSSEKPLTPTFAPLPQSNSLTPPSTCGIERRKSSRTRPKTADASLALNFLQGQTPSEGLSVKRSKSTGCPRSRKSKSTGNLDTMLAIDDVHSTDNSRVSYSDDGSETWSDNELDEEGAAKKARKLKKKQKRVRSWAGAILTRGKGKRHSKPETVPRKPAALAPAPAPPALQLTRTNSEVGSVMEVDFDNDVVVIRTPTNTDAPVSAADRDDESSPPVPTLENSWKPQSFYEQSAQDYDMLSSPIIDLDAALGPFNTPDIRSIADFPSKFSVATQRMYSGGRRGEFIGPEMRYHRRTESAPAMQPFDRNLLGLTRLGGKSSLETTDVFYEEDEDAFLAANQSPRRVETLPASPTIAPTVDDDKVSVDSSGTVETLTGAPVASEPAVDSQSSSKNEGLGIQSMEESIASKEDVSPVMFGQPPRTPVQALKAEELAHGRGPPSPEISPRCFLAADKRPSTSPNELTASIPSFSLSAGVSPSDSSFATPDTRRSFSDRHFLSQSYNDLPSDHPYASVEDVPSLTSSASTMTNTMHRFSNSFLRHTRLSTDRDASFSTARRTSQSNASKRSSLASLSKLVVPSSGRSTLSQESKPPGDSLERSKKKSHRLTKLMHFWKAKDKEKHSMDAAAPLERPQ